VLLVELCVIQMSLDFCRNKDYNNIICESDCLETIEPFVTGHVHTLHTYITDIFHIRVAYIEMTTLLWYILL